MLPKPLRQFHDWYRNIHRLIAITFVLLIEPIKKRHKNSERFSRDPVLLARPQTIVLHQILRHGSSSEFGLILRFSFKNGSIFAEQGSFMVKVV